VKRSTRPPSMSSCCRQSLNQSKSTKLKCSYFFLWLFKIPFNASVENLDFWRGIWNKPDLKNPVNLIQAKVFKRIHRYWLWY
jgi:hypothetical protein